MMASFDEAKSMALEYVREVQTKLTEDGGQTYGQFCQILKQFRLRNIDSSTVVATVEKLFHNHPDLLHAFKPFVPSNSSAAAAAAAPPAKDSDLRDCVDFLNRVGTRFGGNGVYSKFLDCMSAYSRGTCTVSEVCDKILRLFGEHQDLVEEFRSFLPESCIGERSKKRKIDPTDHDQEQRKRRNPNPIKHIDQETLVASRRSTRLPTRNSGYIQEEEGEKEEEEKVAAKPPRKPQRIISSNEKIDFDMEESLCDVDVQIGNLTSTYINAVKLMNSLCGGRLSPADVRLNHHFTPLNLACIRNLYRKLLDNDENPGFAMPELMNRLMKKKAALEKSRVKIKEKWVKIRQSRLTLG